MKHLYLERFQAAQCRQKICILGENKSSKYMSVYIFDSRTEKIQKYDISKMDISGSFFTSDGENFIILTSNNQSTYDLQLFDADNLNWLPVPLKAEEGCEFPSTRSQPAFTVMGNRLVIFGGMKHGLLLNDISVLDLNTYTWIETNWKGSKPFPRRSHQAVSLSDSSVLIFGGNSSDIYYDETMCVLDFKEET